MVATESCLTMFLVESAMSITTVSFPFGPLGREMYFTVPR
jgi:hypothetical protein